MPDDGEKLNLPSIAHELTEDEFKTILNVITGRDRKEIQPAEYEKVAKRYLNSENETFVKVRWWKAVLHMQSKAKEYENKYFLYSTIVIVLSAITTALSGANFANFGNVSFNSITQGSIFFTSLLVTILVSFIKLKQYNEVYMKKFKYAERLKTEGFRFFQLIGDYSNCCDSYDVAFPKFADKVEYIINEINEIFADRFKNHQA
jgi:hypothetical protein